MSTWRPAMGNITEYKHYLRAARHLRYAINSNLADHQFAYERHGEIRYLFDTNVVRFFLNPAAEMRTILGGLALDDEIQASLAIVTAEYLFSRRLCGQWGMPVLISAAHAKEIETHASQIIGNLNQQLSHFDTQSSLREKIAEAIVKASQQEEVESSIRLIFQSDGDVRRIISDAAYEAQMFMRVARGDLLAPLSSDNLMTEGILNPEPREVDAWTNRVAVERRKLPNKHKHYNDPADGETLAQLMLLNRTAEKQRIPVRYVFLTLDSSIHRAVVAAPKPLRKFIRVRRIEQYLPILNVQEMPNQVDHTSFVNDLGAAIDSLLTGSLERLAHQSGSVENESSATYGKGKRFAQWKERRKTDRANQLVEQIPENVGSMWTDLAAECVFLNAGLLSKRLDAFSDLADFLSESAVVRDAVLGYMERTIQDVENVHVQFNIKNMLIAAIQRDSATAGSPTRGLLLMRAKFENFTDGKSLYEFLNDLVLNGDVGALDSVFKDSDESRHYVSLLFAGCVAFWAGTWESAQFFAERAAESFNRFKGKGRRDPISEKEIEYFGIVSRRYAVMDMNASEAERLEALRQHLNWIDSVRKATPQGSDAFAVFRLGLERSMLLVVISYASELCDEASRKAGAACAEEALRGLDACRAQYGEVVDASTDVLLRKQIEAEIYIGLIGCIFYFFFFVPRFPDILNDYIKEIRDKVIALSADKSKIVPQLYRLAPDFIDLMIEPNQQKRREVAENLQKHLQSAEDNVVPATELDKVVMQKMSTHLMSAIESWTSERSSLKA